MSTGIAEIGNGCECGGCRPSRLQGAPRRQSASSPRSVPNFQARRPRRCRAARNTAALAGKHRPPSHLLRGPCPTSRRRATAISRRVCMLLNCTHLPYGGMPYGPQVRCGMVIQHPLIYTLLCRLDPSALRMQTRKICDGPENSVYHHLGGGVPWRQCCKLGMCTNTASAIDISGHIIPWA